MDKEDIIVWYLKHQSAPKAGVTYYIQSVPVKCLEGVRDSYEAMKAERDEVKLNRDMWRRQADAVTSTLYKQEQERDSMKAEAMKLREMTKSLFERPEGLACFIGSVGDRRYYDETITNFDKYIKGEG